MPLSPLSAHRFEWDHAAASWGYFNPRLAPTHGSNRPGPRPPRRFRPTRRYLEVADDAKRRAVDAIADRLATSGLDLSSALGKALAPRRSRTRDSHTDDAPLSKLDPKLLNGMVGAAGFEPSTPSPPD